MSDVKREQFEQWAEEAGALPWGYLKRQRNPSGGYSIQIYTYMWQAWQASCRELVVELPTKEVIQDDGILIPDEFDWPDGYNSGVEACAKVIRALGITVKGEGNER